MKKNIYKLENSVDDDFGKGYFLHLATDYLFYNRFLEYFSKDNDVQFSSASARLLSGTTRIYRELENVLAKMFNKEAKRISAQAANTHLP